MFPLPTTHRRITTVHALIGYQGRCRFKRIRSEPAHFRRDPLSDPRPSVLALMNSLHRDHQITRFGKPLLPGQET